MATVELLWMLTLTDIQILSQIKATQNERLYNRLAEATAEFQVSPKILYVDHVVGVLL